MTYILAGDVGGTKTLLALYAIDSDTHQTPVLIEQCRKTFASSAYESFNDLLEEFLKETNIQRSLHVCLGIAGPIDAQQCKATNLPWIIDAQSLCSKLQLADVFLLNDLEAAAYGMLTLQDSDFVELNPDAKPQTGNIAVIAAGTGLGEAMLAWSGKHHIAMPTEGGHCDFAPGNPQQDALLFFLRERFGGHVSYERILAGDGFGNLYDFLRSSQFAPANTSIEESMSATDRNAIISRAGLAGEDKLCTEALRLFIEIYGSEAGNLALKCLPRGGIYVGGGIAPKIQAALESGEFMQAFLDKGRMTHAIQQIPVRLVTNVDAPLLGAAEIARQRLQN